MHRTSKFYICDGCGEAEWDGHEFIYEVIIHIIGDPQRKIMHFCHECMSKKIMDRLPKAEELK